MSKYNLSRIIIILYIGWRLISNFKRKDGHVQELTFMIWWVIAIIGNSFISNSKYFIPVFIAEVVLYVVLVQFIISRRNKKMNNNEESIIE